jgi:hypothetical protein
VDYLNYLDQNDTAYLEYHQWRSEKPILDIPNASHNTERMYCGICKNVSMRKKLGYPKRMIKSVANWWWVNVHDDECTSGNEIPKWVTDIPTVTMENSYDELKQVTIESENENPKRKKRSTEDNTVMHRSKRNSNKHRK